MKGLFEDFRVALRYLRNKPAFALTTVLTLALGIAANVTIFSTVNGFILRPLPVPHADRIAVLAAQQQGAPVGVYFLSYPELLDFRQQADTFSDFFASQVTLGGMSADQKADHFLGSYVSGNYFSGLGVKAALGRLFLPGEGEHAGSEAEIVLGYSYWQKRFGGSSRVIGKQVLVDGKPATIIGVSPQEFRGTSFALDINAYLPMGMAATQDVDMWTSRDDRQWIVMGRLKPGISFAQAQSSVSMITARLAQQYPATDKGLDVRVKPERMSRPVPLPNDLIAVIAALFLSLAVVVLLLACVNVANVLLVRATARETEMAVRTALGASRGRLIAQVLVESMLLALFGALAGLGLGALATRQIADFRLASFIPITLDWHLDWRVLGYALALSLSSGVLVGLWPALRVPRANLNQALREGGRSGSTGAGRHRMRSIMAGVQLAGSLILLIIAGLFARSLQSVQHMYLGFEPNHLLNVILDPHEAGYDPARTTTFYKELADRVRALPGVQSVCQAFSVPMGNYNTSDVVKIADHPTPPGQQAPMIMNNPVDPAYFETMGIPLLRGRGFTNFDNETSSHVAVINRTMAEQFWPKEDAIGKRFEAKGTWWQVVGIAENGKYAFVGEDPRPYFYLPLPQSFVSMRTLQVRTSIAPQALITPVRQLIKSMDPDLPTFSLMPMNDSLAGANGFMIFRIGALLASLIGGLGLVMAAVGVYGVVAFAASQRTREIGIRVALGATRGHVLTLVLRQGLWVVTGGAALGVLFTLGVSRSLANLLVGVSATDPVTFAAATLFLIAVALYACYVPARRAMKVDPMVALRYE
ncbi:MAG: ABC transporter permease [Acidobacteria bacterium]|nr:ABC transporter permease [Acidobacteriota bacterium]